MLILFLLQAAAAQQPISLTCLGNGTTTESETSVVSENGSVSGMIGATPYSGTASTSGLVSSSHEREFSDQVDIRVFSGDDRIRLPRTMLPTLHGGKDGWFKLKGLTADKRSIKAKAAVSLIENPNVFIDRLTGTVTVSGSIGHYSGHCEVVDDSAATKF